eukprot:CAMPEP_0170599556 /NCGR_PEP_ID=MMETSP0224-20130122/16863_1 /TAXON_ID=285029 /ORGANISM="Togula jolla, Strain CCCM 725" /LENGTH=422 /DNA_ID=CAMNT_0010924221 /DNA_START=148 /DNA_END=1416 /DNA_ORIENTATION=-
MAMKGVGMTTATAMGMETLMASSDELEVEQDMRKLKVAVYCALFFMLVEIVGGIVANSLAIVTDAAHMLSDAGGFIVSLLALQLSQKAATAEYTYGFKQAEILGALLSIMIVWALTAVLLWEALYRLIDPQEIEGETMFIISVIGFVVNLVLMQVLGHGHSHDEHGGHGHAHSSGGGKEGSAAVQAAMAHVIGDVVQSLGVCLAALCIWLKPFDVGETDDGVSRWNYADPMCTVLFGILVLYTTKSTLLRTVGSLMVKAPAHVHQERLMEKLGALPNVDSVHDVHVWSLGSREVLCTAHVMVNGRENAMNALKGCIKVAQAFGVGHSTFQIELTGEFDPALESYGNLCRNPSVHIITELTEALGVIDGAEVLLVMGTSMTLPVGTMAMLMLNTAKRMPNMAMLMLNMAMRILNMDMPMPNMA